MREAHPDTVDRGAAGRKGCGPVAFGATDWLCLAATPAFAVMALLAIGHDGGADMFCPGTHGMSPPGGMSLMYALMSIFHSTPWLKLISNRLGRTR